MKNDRAQMPAGERETLRQKGEVQLRGVHAFGDDALPNAEPLVDAGQWKIDQETQPAQESFVEILLAIGREDGQAFESLHPLEQVADFEVGVAIVRVLHFGAFAEERVGFVEEEDDVAGFGGVEQPAQIFLRLADVFVDHLREVDAEERQAQLRRDHFRGHGFAGAGRAGEERGEPAFAPGAGRAPFVVHQSERAHRLDHFAQLLRLFRREHQILAAESRLDRLRQIAQIEIGPAGVEQVVRRDRPFARPEIVGQVEDGLFFVTKTARAIRQRRRQFGIATRLREMFVPKFEPFAISQRRNVQRRQREGRR